MVADNLTVIFGRGRNRTHALDGFAARFGQGITGLVGPNGAGKSTFLRTACGLLSPSGGSLTVGGLSDGGWIARHGAGFLPETPPLRDYLEVGEFLSGLAAGDHGHATDPRSNPLDPFELLPGLRALIGKRLGVLSLGQKKKVAMAAALLGATGLLLLDEPTNGLDPSAVRELRDALTELGRRGLTIVVSSHHLDELQRIADALVFVRDGRALGAWTRPVALAEFGSFDNLYERTFREIDS
jgi:ABC-2 type transport system ATP-binding protein